MYIGVHVSFQISMFILFGYIYTQELNRLVVWQLSYSLLRNFCMFSTVAAPIYILTNSVQGFLFFYILANICLTLFANLVDASLQCLAFSTDLVENRSAHVRIQLYIYSSNKCLLRDYHSKHVLSTRMQTIMKRRLETPTLLEFIP